MLVHSNHRFSQCQSIEPCVCQSKHSMSTELLFGFVDDASYNVMLTVRQIILLLLMPFGVVFFGADDVVVGSMPENLSLLNIVASITLAVKWY